MNDNKEGTMTPKTEASPLLSNSDPLQMDAYSESASSLSGSTVSKLLLLVQVIFFLFFVCGTTYPEEEYSVKEYIAFRDIMAMLLLGFGFLMTFLKSYGLGAVGFTMILTVLSMQANIPMELGLRYLKGETGEDTSWPLPLSMTTLIDAEFSAATLLITFGALIGRASPLQMFVIALSEAFFYAFNKVFLVLGHVGAEDVGGSMTIHMFGAYFGLAASYALGPAKDPSAAKNGEPDKTSDIFAMIGTTILWVFWPSFVGATETGVPENEMRCVINTICALLASTASAFYVSHMLMHSKFDPVHVANSTLAGGVAIGSAARLDIGPGSAIVVGALAGAVSVVGYVHSTPFLESKFSIQDTCGVGNLHGWPSIIGGLASILFVACDSDAEFLQNGVASQMIRQLLGVIATLTVSITSGYATGMLISDLKDDATPSYTDDVWWHAEYFDANEH
jgi:ammonium transporter Rh